MQFMHPKNDDRVSCRYVFHVHTEFLDIRSQTTFQTACALDTSDPFHSKNIRTKTPLQKGVDTVDGRNPAPPGMYKTL